MADRSSRKITSLVKRRLFHARQFWSQDNSRYGRLLAENLLLNHYKADSELTKDRRRIQPKTQKQFNLARHKTSLLMLDDLEFDTHASQPGADAGAAEVSRRVIQNIFSDPLKGYADVRERMIWSMLAAERGNVAIDWHQKWGVCFRFVDPRRLHITPGFTFLHDPRNPVVIEEIPMRLSEVKAQEQWDVPGDLTGDGGLFEYDTNSMGNTRESDGIERDQAGHMPGGDENDQDDPIVTIVKTWFREDPYGRDNKRLANADLPESDWHFVDDQTGQKVPFDPMNPQPPVGQMGNPMRFVTSKSEMYSGQEYDEGYLCIIAPGYHGDAPLFEGKWLEGAINPDVTMAAFPYMELTSYKHPLKRSGISDTELTHSLTVVDNVSFRNAWEQMNATGGILITKPGGLKDSQGNQFRITNEPINIAYADDLLQQEAIKFFQAPGMNSAAPAFRSMIENQWQSIGSGDFSASLGPERSKDIAVGTANLLQQTGDLPTKLHKKSLDLQEGIAGRVALDYCRAYMGDQVVSWVTDEGEVAYANVRGSDLVPLNVTVVANKNWRQQDVDRVQATAQLLGMIGKMGLPPGAVGPLLREAGISASVAMAISDAMAQQQAPPPAGNVPPGPPAPPQPGGPPELSLLQGGMENG